jgi:hypothetical protein
MTTTVLEGLKSVVKNTLKICKSFKCQAAEKKLPKENKNVFLCCIHLK